MLWPHIQPGDHDVQPPVCTSLLASINRRVVANSKAKKNRFSLRSLFMTSQM